MREHLSTALRTPRNILIHGRSVAPCRRAVGAKTSSAQGFRAQESLSSEGSLETADKSPGSHQNAQAFWPPVLCELRRKKKLIGNYHDGMRKVQSREFVRRWYGYDLMTKRKVPVFQPVYFVAEYDCYGVFERSGITCSATSRGVRMFLRCLPACLDVPMTSP